MNLFVVGNFLIDYMLMLSDMRQASHVFYSLVSINHGWQNLVETLLGGEEGWGIFVNRYYSGWCFYYCHHMANQKEWTKTNKLWIKFCVVSASCLLLEWNMYTFQLVGEQISNGKICSNNWIVSSPIMWLMENCWTLPMPEVYDVASQLKFKEPRSSDDIIIVDLNKFVI